MEASLIEELESALKNEEIRCTQAAQPTNPVERNAKAEADLGACLGRFEGIFGEAARDLLQDDHGLGSWSQEKLQVQAPQELVGRGEAFHLRLGEDRGILVQVNLAKDLGLWLYEPGWAPLHLARSHRSSRSTQPTTAENLALLVDGLKEILQQAQVRQALYDACLTRLQGGAKGFLTREFGPEIMQGAFVSDFVEMGSALQAFAQEAVGEEGFKDPRQEAFLRSLIQEPHTLVALKHGVVAEPYRAPWMLVRVPKAGHTREVLDLGQTLVATVLPVPGVKKGLNGEGVGGVVRVPVGPLGFSVDLKGLGANGILLELAAALKGLLLEV